MSGSKLKTKLKLTKKLLQDLYDVLGSVSTMAKYIKCPRTTLGQKMKLLNIKVKRGHPKGKKHKKWNALNKWLQDHKETFPRNMLKIAKATGINYNTIKCHFWWNERRLKDYLKTLGDLRRTNIKLTTKNGRVFPLKYAKYYTVKIDKFTEMYKITLYLKPNAKKRITFKIKKEDLYE